MLNASYIFKPYFPYVENSLVEVRKKAVIAGTSVSRKKRGDDDDNDDDNDNDNDNKEAKKDNKSPKNAKSKQSGKQL